MQTLVVYLLKETINLNHQSLRAKNIQNQNGRITLYKQEPKREQAASPPSVSVKFLQLGH